MTTLLFTRVIEAVARLRVAAAAAGLDPGDDVEIVVSPALFRSLQAAVPPEYVQQDDVMMPGRITLIGIAIKERQP